MKPRIFFLSILLAFSAVSAEAVRPNEALDGETTSVDLDFDPEAIAIIDGFIEATGGREAKMAVKHMTCSGTFAIPGKDRSGNIILRYSKGNKVHSVLDEMPFSKFVHAYNGEVGWYEGTDTGAGFFQGEDLAQLAKNSSMFPEIDLEAHYVSIQKEPDNENGDYVLRLTDKRGYVETWIVDSSSNLILSMDFTIDGGVRRDYKAQYFLSNYKWFGKILLETRTEVVNPISTSVIEIDSIDLTTRIPDSLYEFPGYPECNKLEKEE